MVPAAFVACLQLAALQANPLHAIRAATHVRSSCPAASTAIGRLSGVDEYESLLDRTRAEGSAAIVEFSTDSCVACAKMAPKIAVMQSKWPDVEFVEIRVEKAGKAFFKASGVVGVPHIHLVGQGVVLDSFSCPPAKLCRIEDRLNTHGFGKLRRGWLRRQWRKIRTRYIETPDEELLPPGYWGAGYWCKLVGLDNAPDKNGSIVRIVAKDDTPPTTQKATGPDGEYDVVEVESGGTLRGSLGGEHYFVRPANLVPIIGTEKIAPFHEGVAPQKP